MTSLCVATISYNEEDDLGSFIDHLLPWVDEIVIVDDGSTDRTAQIARSYGSPVHFIVSPRMEDEGFSNQRNKCIEHSTSDWILHLDVDERVLPETATEIRRAIEAENLNAYRYRRLNFFLHRPMRHGGWQHWNNPQLARRGKHRFVNKVHEVCEIEGGEPGIGQLENPVWHLNDTDYCERIRKNVQYTPLSADRILEGGFRIRWYHLVFRPLRRFFKSYFLQGGFRAGTRGLVLGIYTFTSTFNWWACAWDRQNRIDRATLEEEVRQAWREAPINPRQGSRQ